MRSGSADDHLLVRTSCNSTVTSVPVKAVVIRRQPSRDARSVKMNHEKCKECRLCPCAFHASPLQGLVWPIYPLCNPASENVLVCSGDGLKCPVYEIVVDEKNKSLCLPVLPKLTVSSPHILFCYDNFPSYIQATVHPFNYFNHLHPKHINLISRNTAHREYRFISAPSAVLCLSFLLQPTRPLTSIRLDSHISFHIADISQLAKCPKDRQPSTGKTRRTRNSCVLLWQPTNSTSTSTMSPEPSVCEY